MSVEKSRLEYGLLRQMDIQNAMYPSRIPVMTEQPSDLEFSRLIHDNFPALFRNAANSDSGFPAINRWSIDYLKESLSQNTVKVSETPFGNADSPLHDVLFIKPHIRSVNGSDLIDLLNTDDGIVRYMQSQDDNFDSEFHPLTQDALLSIPWAERVLQSPPEAVNMWIGNNIKTTSRLHNDNYENIFVQVKGRKRVYLIPPGDAYALDEKFLIDATYVFDPEDPIQFHIEIDGDAVTKFAGSVSKKSLTQFSEQYTRPRIMFPTVNPANPETYNKIFRGHCKVYKVDLGPGDMLYIPSLWYHQVSIINDDNDLSISLNYWYPPSSLPPLWSRWDYIRLTSALIRGYHDDVYFEEDDDDEL